MESTSLSIRDEMQIDRQKVNDLAERIAEFLPGAKTVPIETRKAMAQIALMHRLDPFLGDIWPIPDRKKVNGEWVTAGYKIMIGITAWRRSAHDTEEYWGRRFEKCDAEERAWLGVGTNDLAIKCIVMRRKTGQQPMEFDGYGVFRKDESSKMNPLQCVRLRAERDALKAAFPIGFGGGAVKIGIADDHGDEINGDVSHEWELVGSAPESHDAQPDAVSNEPPTEPQAQDPTEGYCTIHSCEMRLHEKNGQTWYSHRLDTGDYCNGKVTRKASVKQAA